MYNICIYLCVCVCHVCCILFTNSMAGLLQSCLWLFQIWNSFIGGPETGLYPKSTGLSHWTFFLSNGNLGGVLYTPFSDTQPHIIYCWLCIRYYLPSVIWFHITCWLLVFPRCWSISSIIHQLSLIIHPVSIHYPIIIHQFSINYTSIIHHYPPIIHHYPIIIHPVSHIYDWFASPLSCDLLNGSPLRYNANPPGSAWPRWQRSPCGDYSHGRCLDHRSQETSSALTVTDFEIDLDMCNQICRCSFLDL